MFIKLVLQVFNLFLFLITLYLFLHPDLNLSVEKRHGRDRGAGPNGGWPRDPAPFLIKNHILQKLYRGGN